MPTLIAIPVAKLARFRIDPDAARAIAAAADATTVTIDVDGDAWRALLASLRGSRPQPAVARAPATLPRRMPPPAPIDPAFDPAAERVRLRRGGCCDPPRQ